MLLFWIPLKLFSFNIFEHEFWFWQANIIRKNFWICVIKCNHFWKSWDRFILFVIPFEKLTHVIKNEIVLKNWNYVCLFIVNYVINDLGIVIFFRSQIFLLKIVSNHLWSTNKSCSYFIYCFDWDNFRTIFGIV